MKKTYIARQAILDRHLKTIGYELFFRDSAENKFPEIDQDIASSKLIIQNHIQGDIKTLCMGKLAFINFTKSNLIHKFPLMFDKELIVILRQERKIKLQNVGSDCSAIYDCKV